MSKIHTYVELSHRLELWKAGIEHAICNKPILALSPLSTTYTVHSIVPVANPQWVYTDI